MIFADDTMLFNQNLSLKSLTKKTNIDLKCLCNWLNANLIFLNSTKTEIILFRPKRNATNYDARFKLNRKRLYPSKVVKYLGVLIVTGVVILILFVINSNALMVL